MKRKYASPSRAKAMRKVYLTIHGLLNRTESRFERYRITRWLESYAAEMDREGASYV